MANHVYTSVVFRRISEAGEKRLEELYQRLEDIDDPEVYSYDASKIFGIDESEDGPGTYSWNIEHMGAKWCYFEDCDPDGFRTESAWSVPWNLIEYVLNEVAKVDPTIYVTVTYEDEMPNFTGWATWWGGSFDEGREWEWKEILEWMRDHNEVLAGAWDPEKEEWTEEAEEDGGLNDIIWDEQINFMEDVREATLSEEVEWFFKHENDEDE